MKKIFFVSLILLSISSYAQNDESRNEIRTACSLVGKEEKLKTSLGINNNTRIIDQDSEGVGNVIIYGINVNKNITIIERGGIIDGVSITIKNDRDLSDKLWKVIKELYSAIEYDRYGTMKYYSVHDRVNIDIFKTIGKEEINFMFYRPQ